jgi:hypothetical protein
MKLPEWVRVPKTPTMQFFFYGSTELFTFFIITANFRAIAIGSYWWAGVTDYLTVLVNFWVGKLMMDDAKNRSWWVGFGFATGGTIGTLLSIWATKHLYGR